MAREMYSTYHTSRALKARLRSARNGKVPGGKPRGMCRIPGCINWGIGCYYPDWEWGGPDGGPRNGPDDCLCPRHIERGGFCQGCGLFWGGVESFEFGTLAGYCDNCASEIRAEEEYERRGWDDDYEGYDPDRQWDDIGPIVIIGGFPEEVFAQ